MNIGSIIANIKKKILRTIMLFACLIIGSKSFSQEATVPKNSIYLELLGNAGLYSVNYERSLHPNTIYRIGFSTFRTIDLFGISNPGRISTFPLMISFLTGHNKHHFEMGGGILLGKWRESSGSELIFDLTSFIGYRFQAPGNSFLFKVGVAPMVSLSKTNYPDSFFVSPGLGLGYNF